MNNKALNREFALKYTKRTGLTSSEEEDDSTGKCKFSVIMNLKTYIYNDKL